MGPVVGEGMRESKAQRGRQERSGSAVTFLLSRQAQGPPVGAQGPLVSGSLGEPWVEAQLSMLPCESVRRQL